MQRRRNFDWTGFKNGKLTVIGKDRTEKRNGINRFFWLCQCECGNTTTIISISLKITKSCGCIHLKSVSKINYKHGGSGTKEFNCWYAMKSRCLNPNNNRYNRYGGRGIMICDRWLHSFANFIEDMGKMPIGQRYTIDRINNDGNYEPSNCKWSTYKEQANNRSNSLYIS